MRLSLKIMKACTGKRTDLHPKCGAGGYTATGALICGCDW